MTTDTVRDLLPSIVRTVVPIVVGALLAVAARAGFDLDAGLAAPLVDAVIMGGYYTAVRVAEQRWPLVGVLLGWAVSPTYGGDALDRPL